MAAIEIEDIASSLRPGQTLAALDLGTKTIGIAVSDVGLSLANPRPAIRRRKFSQDRDTLVTRMREDDVGALVVGLPVNMDGTEGPRAQSTRAFVRNLMRDLIMPVAFWDERLSTVAAERALLEQDMSRTRRAERIDSAAAAFILQGVLDRLHSAGADR